MSELVVHYQRTHPGITFFFSNFILDIHFVISLDADLSLPTIFEKNMQKSLNTLTNRVGYYKCKQCETVKFSNYTNYKKHVYNFHLSDNIALSSDKVTSDGSDKNEMIGE
jgi:hypothetical protein